MCGFLLSLFEKKLNLMIRLRQTILPLLFFSLLVFSGCRKSPVLNEDGQPVIQGNVVLNVHVMHHTWGVPYIRVYIKRNATEFPGEDTTLYDSYIQADNEGWVQFNNLYPGNYYLYATGYDYYFAAPVIGHIPVTFSAETLVNNTAEITLYVSE